MPPAADGKAGGIRPHGTEQLEEHSSVIDDSAKLAAVVVASTILMCATAFAHAEMARSKPADGAAALSSP